MRSTTFKIKAKITAGLHSEWINLDVPLAPMWPDTDRMKYLSQFAPKGWHVVECIMPATLTIERLEAEARAR